jgi:hypothetical protein
MRMRCIPLVGLVCLLAVPPVARSADAEASRPTAVLRLASIDHLMADFHYLASLGGKEDQARQYGGFVQSMLGSGKVDGLDTKRPIYAYGAISPDGFNGAGAVLVPITNEKAILGSLENFNLKAEKGDDGVYTVKPGSLPVDIYIRFANQYAYVTARDKSALEKDRLIAPSALLPADKGGTLTVLFRLDQTPDAVKQIVLGQMDLKLADEKEKRDPGETDAQHQAKVQIIEHTANKIKSVINEGGELTLHLNVDRKAGRLSGTISLAGKPGSKLATDIAEFGRAPSMFGGALSGESALTVLLHGKLPEELEAKLGPAIDEGIRKGLEKEQNEAKREQAAKVLKALAPTLKSRDLDAVFRLLGPDTEHHYTLVAAAKLKQGAKLDHALRDLVKSLPEGERAIVTLDAETADGVKVHRIDAHKGFDEKARRTFGENPFYLAVRDDAVVVGGGPNGLEALKEVLSARPGAAPPFVLDLSMAKIAVVSARDSGDPHRVKAVEEAVKNIKGNDQIHIVLEGGQAVTLRVTAQAEAIKLMTILNGGQSGRRVAPKKKTDDD